MAATDKAARRTRHGAILLPWAALATGIIVSVAFWLLIQDSVENVAEERFERQATEAKQVIERRILSYAGILYGARAFFAANGGVNRLQFHRFVRSLELKQRFPGFDVMNYAAYVHFKDKQRFVEEVRNDTSLDARGYPEFAIKPPGEREEYFVMVYVEPMSGFEFAFGLDIGANPAVVASDRNAVANLQHSARDTGNLTASGLPIRIKGAREYIGLAMRLPVYRSEMPLNTVAQRRAAYLGSVGAGFNVQTLMDGVLDPATMQYMQFKLYGPQLEGAGPDSSGNERVLFDSSRLPGRLPDRVSVGDQDSTFARAEKMEIAGRTWEIFFSAPKDAIVGRVDRLVSSIVLASGLLLSLLLFGTLYSLSSSRSRAVKIADQITKDLRETEERFRLIAENASDLISLIDREGRRIYVNPAFGRLFGNHKALIGTDAFRDVHPEDKERVRETFSETVRDGAGRGAEFRFLLPNGEVRYIESHRSAVSDSNGRVAHIIAVSRDVTERQKAEDALRARDVQLQEAQNLAKLGSWEWDVHTNKRTWSEQMLRNFGISEARPLVTFEDFLELVHPDDRERMKKTLREALEAGDVYENEYRIMTPKGELRRIYARASIERDESGRAVRMLGVSQDVTDRKRLEEHARATEERFRMMVENVRDYAIYMLDTKGHITSWNLGAERIKGYRADEVIGRHYSCFFLPEHATRGDPGIQLEFAALQGRYESEGWRVRKDGTRFWAHVIATPLRDELGKLRGFSEITHDITERKRAEEDLHNYAERLRVTSRRLVEVQESERRLIARELHDRVGQNLTGLGLNLSIVASGLAAIEKPELAARLDDSSLLVRDTVDAIRNVMAELRPHTLDEYGLPAALRSLAAGFSRRTGIHVAFEGDSERADFPKTVDLALFRIAQEALNNVAKHSSADRVEIAIRRRNGHATLSVRDNGVGFDPEHVDALREGSGWGLLIMRERAEAVGARFSLKAEPDAGVNVLVEYHGGLGA